MLINTGGRTDLVHFYTPWLLERFRKGYVYVRNPLYPETVSRYDLNPSVVDCVLFCSKNYAPILPRLEEITSKFNTYFFYTITAYGRDIEPLVPDIDSSIDTLIKLEKIVGKERIVWRYDPILFTKKYTMQQHLITFGHMAARLSGHVSACIFSFVELYNKTILKMPELQAPDPDTRMAMASALSQTAQKYRIPLYSCVSKDDFSIFGIEKKACVTLEALGRANNVKFRELSHSGMRKGCCCMQSSDIGAYNSCPAGCLYCYATESFEEAKKVHAMHDASSPILTGKVKPEDRVSYARQKSYLVNPPPQLLLFE